MCTYSGTGLLLTRIDLLLLNEISFYETDNRSEKNVHNRGIATALRGIRCSAGDLTTDTCTAPYYIYYYCTVYNTIPVSIIFCGVHYDN